ncbi:MAG TPA: hypothetical protein VGO68_10940 [Pyrinomonadaceae bacterium]|jgi:hypothetical protein|nr:hypothetical protein [Pyrinomonadaceae bacterium]
MPLKNKTVSAKSTRRKTVKPVDRGKASSLSSKGNRPKVNGIRYERPQTKPGETTNEREKHRAELEALTLRAFQIAYDNHRSRHSS